MDDDVKLTRDKMRGEKIRAMTSDADFRAVVKALEAEYWKKWVNTHPHERELREQIYHQMTAMKDVLRHLDTVAGRGKFTQASLKLLEDAVMRRNAG